METRTGSALREVSRNRAVARATSAPPALALAPVGIDGFPWDCLQSRTGLQDDLETNCSWGSRFSGRCRCLKVLDDMVQFLVELLERIPPTVEVVAEVSHERGRVGRLLLRHDVTSSRAMQASGTSNAPPSARDMTRNSSPPLIPSRREKSRRVRTRDPVDIGSEVYSGFLQGRSSRSLVGPRDFASLTKSTSPTCCESSARSTRVAARSAREMWYGPWRRSFPPT